MWNGNNPVTAEGKIMGICKILGQREGFWSTQDTETTFRFLIHAFSLTIGPTH